MPTRLPPALRRIWPGGLSRLALVARRLALHTEAGRARPLWRGLYELLARGLGWILTAGQTGASAYVAASIAEGEPVYGLSDIDLVLVSEDPATARRRWQRLGRALPPLGAIVSDLATYTAAELEEAAAAVTFSPSVRSVYLGQRSNGDDRGLRERPGLGGPTADWRRLSGPEQRPAGSVMTPQQVRIAAWLELQFWWRQAMRLAARDLDEYAAYTSLKLVTNAARAWLALDRPPRSPLPSGGGALSAALVQLPEEEAALRCALSLRGSLSRPPDEAIVNELLRAFARLSDRVAHRLHDAAGAAGTTEVDLLGVLSDPAAPLPLVDWRGVVLPTLPDETLVPACGDPGDRSALAAAVRAAGARSYAGLRAGDLLVLAATEHWTRSFLRGVACPPTDPVSFALLSGSDVARFSRLPGWSVQDLARRAVTEHRAWLAHAPADGTLSKRTWLDGRMAGVPAPTRTAAKLLTAARAALLHDTLAEGSPRLAIAMEAIAAELAARYPASRTAVQQVTGAYATGELPDPSALRALRDDLRRLPIYAAEVPARPAGDAVPA